jgi:hypothetical protein
MASLIPLTAEAESVGAARSQVQLEVPGGTCVILETIEADGAPAKIQVWAGDQQLKPVVLAVKSWYRESAGTKTGSGICDSRGCNGHLVAGNSYLMPGPPQFFCERCTNKLLGQNVDWDQAVKDIDGWVGPGVPSDVKTLISHLHLT